MNPVIKDEDYQKYKPDGRSSLGSYDDQESFAKAFKLAHSRGGPGHTFTYRGKLYTTNCADKGNYRKEKDDRN